MLFSKPKIAKQSKTLRMPPTPHPTYTTHHNQPLHPIRHTLHTTLHIPTLHPTIYTQHIPQPIQPRPIHASIHTSHPIRRILCTSHFTLHILLPPLYILAQWPSQHTSHPQHSPHSPHSQYTTLSTLTTLTTHPTQHAHHTHNTAHSPMCNLHSRLPDHTG